MDHSYFKDFMEDLDSLSDELFLSDMDESMSKENFFKANVDMKIKSLNFSNQSIKNIRYGLIKMAWHYTLFISAESTPRKSDGDAINCKSLGKMFSLHNQIFYILSQIVSGLSSI